MASPMKPMNVNPPSEYDRRHGNDHRQRETVADDVGHGAPPFHCHAEVALEDETHPLRVLNRDGLVEAELLAQCLRFAFGHRAA